MLGRAVQLDGRIARQLVEPQRRQRHVTAVREARRTAAGATGGAATGGGGGAVVAPNERVSEQHTEPTAPLLAPVHAQLAAPHEPPLAAAAAAAAAAADCRRQSARVLWPLRRVGGR